MALAVYTIGHGTARFAEVAAVLDRHGVADIVDVRSQPYSRVAPDFSRPALEVLCAAHGVGYRWMGSVLGGRPADPALQLADGSADFEAIRRSTGFRAALLDLAALAAEARVALLCAEGRPEHCHRALLLAPALEAMGLRVVHLLPDGSAPAHQETLGI